MSSQQAQLPTYFIGHGGVGILFQEHAEPIRKNLYDLGKEIKSLKPDAIVITSGHFQSSDNTIEVNIKEPTKVWHDFSFDWHSTFPHVYEYQYSHKSSRSLGETVLAHLQSQGVNARAVERDLDHGVWVPFKLMFPENEAEKLNVPIVEISVYQQDNWEAHIQLGRILRTLPGRILVISSGMAVHNLQARSATDRPSTYPKDVEEAIIESLHTSAEHRKRGFLELPKRQDWTLAHPTNDHVLPLYVALGAGEREIDYKIWNDGLYSNGMSYISFRLGDLV